MRIGAFSFRPGVATTLATVAFVALTLWLGRWQLERAGEKQARQALLDARAREIPVVLTGSVPDSEPLLYRRVRATGEWMADRQLFIDNQILDGRAGFAVVTPLRLEGSGDALLVNRGWIARDASYPRAPAVPVPGGRVQVGGLATLPPARFLELSPEAVSGDVWQNLSIERFRQRTGLKVVPVEVMLDPPAEGLRAIQEKPYAGVEKHQEYAFTWFSLAALALALWIGLNFRRAR